MNLSELVPSGVKSAILAKVARWVGTLGGGVVAGYIFSHSEVLSVLNQACASISSPEAMTAAFSALAVAALTLISSVKDAKKVDAKITVAAAAGVAAGRAGLEDHTTAVATAIAVADQAAPKNKEQLLASLAQN